MGTQFYDMPWSVVMGVCPRRFCLNVKVGWAFVCSGEYCFRVMYGELYGVCDCFVFSVVDICVEYGGVYVFHVRFYLCVVHCVGVCVNVGGAICVVVCCLFLASGCCLLCRDAV